MVGFGLTFYYFIFTYKKLTYCENIVKFACVNITVSSYKYLKENREKKKTQNDDWLKGKKKTIATVAIMPIEPTKLTL